MKCCVPFNFLNYLFAKKNTGGLFSPVHVPVPVPLTVNDQISWDDTIPFVFPTNGGRVIKVYDGDTITIACKLPYAESPWYRLPVRIYGIDAPEIKGSTEEEKCMALEARDYLSDLILNKEVRLENIATEKYGRLLANVYIDNINISELLIKERLAIKYDGKTKNPPKSWLKYKVTGEI